MTGPEDTGNRLDQAVSRNISAAPGNAPNQLTRSNQNPVPMKTSEENNPPQKKGHLCGLGPSSKMFTSRPRIFRLYRRPLRVTRRGQFVKACGSGRGLPET